MGRVITLGIKGRREGQNVGGTELDAEGAAFTALHINGDETLRHGNPP
jgi:hypothetical protein